MSQQLVEYISTSRLACANCTPANVILCITPPTIVVNPTCPTDISGNPPGTGITDGTGLISEPGEDRPQKSYIEATIVTFVQTRDACNKPVYRYIFSYDDTQIVLPPNTVFTAANIVGVFCEGCLTDWVRDLVGEDVTVEEREAGIITIRNQHGCEFAFRRGWTRLVQEVNGDITVTYPDLSTETISLSVNVATLTDNGDRSFTFDNNVDTPVTFFQGIQTITPAAGCETVGVNNMLRSLSVTGGNLTVSSAPEHAEFSVPEASASGSSLGIAVIAGDNYFSNPADLTITNPSACRAAVAMCMASGFIEFDSAAAMYFVLALQISVDGGAYTDIVSKRSYMPPGTVTNRWEIGLDKSFLRSLTVSQVENIRVRIRLTPISANISVDSYSITNIVIGGTR